jgi:Raf kinase inhibitor-like YbhB/YbcL family protein
MSGHDLGYYGPCPPSGTHRYFFKLYALDTMLDLGYDSSAEDLMKALAGHILVNTELVGISSK